VRCDGGLRGDGCLRGGGGGGFTLRGRGGGGGGGGCGGYDLFRFLVGGMGSYIASSMDIGYEMPPIGVPVWVTGKISFVDDTVPSALIVAGYR
jgi:hypothetical protein